MLLFSYTSTKNTLSPFTSWTLPTTRAVKRIHCCQYNEVFDKDKEPMKIAGLLSLGFRIKSGLAFNRILENKLKDGLDFEGWASTANGFSLSTWPRISKFSTALVDLPQVQLIIFTKQGWWKMDPHKLHLAASASCNESKIPPFTWQDIFFVDIRLQSKPVKFGSIIDQCLILAGHNPLASQYNLT